jgi:DNA processing protein
MTESEAYVAFNLTDQIGSVGVGRLVAQYGSAALAWENHPAKISRSGRAIDWRAEYDQAKTYGVRIVTAADAGYPAALRATRGHPLVLYVKGSVAALSRPSVAIVGTRRATAYGLDQAHRFGCDLAAAGWCVVSGLALGIDAQAHQGALAAGGVTVGILGSALDRFYPEENRALAREIVEKGGAVVSEFPFGREPDTQTFPQRNRVVAALAKGVLAIETPVKGGTLITTSVAADLGRTVMALPGRVDSPRSAGCLHLIREGATLVRHAADVNEALGSLFASAPAAPSGSAAPKPAAETPRPAVTLEESMILRELGQEGVTLDRLVSLTGFPAGKVSSLCMALRLKEQVRFLPGNRVALPREK